MIKVFDDFIPYYHQECILKQSHHIDWKLSENVSGVQHDSDLGGLYLSENQNGYYENVFSLESSSRDDIMLGLCLPMIALAKSYIKQDVVLERIRMGKFDKSDSGGIHRPHTDYFTDHYTLLYYVNNSDGNTFLFKQKAEPANPVYPSKFAVMDSVEPRMGRAILFDGLTYHSSSSPSINENRVAININLMVRS